MHHHNHPLRYSVCVALITATTTLVAGAEPVSPIGLPLSDTSSEQYRQAVASIEKDHGAHHFGIVEPAIGLGINLQQQNQHDQAITALKRALHVNRINRGLHDLNHIPIIDLISHSQMQLGDWQGAEQQQMLRFWMYQREVETSEQLTPETLDAYTDAAIHFSNWQGQSYTWDTGRFPLVKLRHAQKGLADAKNRLVTQNRTLDPRYFAVLNAIAVNDYNIVIYLSNTEADAVTGSTSGDQDMSDYLLRQNIIVDSFREGSAALREVIELNDSDARRTQYAQAILNYADWQLLFNRPQTAAKEYSRAYDAFRQAGIDNTSLNERFAEPQRITAFKLEPPSVNPGKAKRNDPDSAQQTDAPYVLAIFDVNRHGQVRNLDIEESFPADDKSIRRAARNRLVVSRFRPALIDGKPVVRKDVKIRYLFSSYDRPVTGQ